MEDFGNKANFEKQKDDKLKYTLPRNLENKMKTKIEEDTFPKILNQKLQEEQIKKVKRKPYQRNWGQILPQDPAEYRSKLWLINAANIQIYKLDRVKKLTDNKKIG